ncbi:MAG: hypothetical protein U0T85_01730 [Cloacibacterium normanense]
MFKNVKLLVYEVFSEEQKPQDIQLFKDIKILNQGFLIFGFFISKIYDLFNKNLLNLLKMA